MIAAASQAHKVPLRAPDLTANSLGVRSDAMQDLAQRICDTPCTRAANDNCFKGGARDRTKFCYDSLYRLTEVRTGGTCTSPLSLQVGYNAMGNITSRTDVSGGQAWSYSHPTKPHAVTAAGAGTSFSYDDNGNMNGRTVNGASWSIGWTSFNYPTTISGNGESAALLYGPSRQYYRQDYSGASGTETTHYIGGLLEKVQNANGTDWRHYIMAGDSAVAIVNRQGTNSFVHYALEDHLGSPSMFTDGSGGIEVRESFGPFGRARNGTAWSGPVSTGDKAAIASISRRGYTGHSMLGDMDLIHMNGRVYDAVLGRFLSPDPYVFEPGSTQGFNRYAYVSNNPMTHSDPSGFCTMQFGYFRDYGAEAARRARMLDAAQRREAVPPSQAGMPDVYEPPPLASVEIIAPLPPIFGSGNYLDCMQGPRAPGAPPAPPPGWVAIVPPPVVLPQSEAELARIEACRKAAQDDNGKDVQPWVRNNPTVWNNTSRLQPHLNWAMRTAASNQAYADFLDGGHLSRAW